MWYVDIWPGLITIWGNRRAFVEAKTESWSLGFNQMWLAAHLAIPKAWKQIMAWLPG